MPYCTLSDIQAMETESTLIQLTAEDGQDEVDEALVDAAIATADAEADLYLRARYPVVPIPAPVPVALMRISRDLALYELYSRRAQGSMPENVKARRDRAIELLEALQNGKASLGIEPATGSGAYVGNKICQDRVFDDAAIRAYKLGGRR